MTVSIPELAAAILSLAGFALLVMIRRLGAGREAGNKRDLVSLAGILVQSAAFFIACTGRIDGSRPWNDGLALLLTILVAVLGGSAVALFAGSTRALGRHWSLVARTRADHQLVRHGPFAHVRHPIYLAMLLLLVALGVGFGHPLGLAISIPVFLLGTLIRTRIEDRLLRASFGPAFDEYARSVPALIPRL